MKVSVAMATYNGQEFIKEQLDSILSQSRLPDEIVIVDDVSTDNTYSICEEYAALDQVPIKLYKNNTNLGFTKNFEKAISLCSGDIIFISDQDDVWKNIKIEYMLRLFSEVKDVGLVYCDAKVVDEDLRHTEMTVFSTRGISEIWKGEERNPIDVIKSPNIKGCTLAFSSQFRDVILPVPIKNSGQYWGYDHWIAFILFAISKVSVMNEELMYYRIHTNNTSGNLKINKKNHEKLNWSNSIKYSSSSVLKKLERYSTMINRLKNIEENKIFFLDKYYTYLNILQKEENLLKRRVEIWEENKLLRRILMIFQYLKDGHYFRYKLFIGPLVKDILRINKQ